jgi:hypothetical protein
VAIDEACEELVIWRLNDSFVEASVELAGVDGFQRRRKCNQATRAPEGVLPLRVAGAAMDTLRYRVVSPDTLMLEGDFGGERITLTLKRVPKQRYALRSLVSR